MSRSFQFSLRALLLAMFVASIAAAVLAVGLGAGKNFPHPAVVAGYGLLFAQVGTAAIWLGMGNSTIVVRLGAFIAVVAAVYSGLSILHDNQGQWTWLLAVQTFAIVSPLAAARWYGLRLQSTTSGLNEQPWQFTLKHLFTLTTGCALFLGLFRLMPRLTSFHSRAFEALLIGAGFALLALVAVWVALGHGRPLLKLLALPTVTFLVGGVLIATEGSRSLDNELGVLSIVFGQMLFLAAPLAVLRRRGYRLMPCGPRSSIV